MFCTSPIPTLLAKALDDFSIPVRADLSFISLSRHGPVPQV